MRVAWVLLLLVPALGGCVDDGEGNIFTEIFRPDRDLDGQCGHVYRQAWDQQIILHVRMSANASKVVDVQDLVIDATHHDGEQLRGYDRPRSPDAQGCVAFPLKGEGGYFFLALGFREGSSKCYVKGQMGGTFDGEFSVAQGILKVEQRGTC